MLFIQTIAYGALGNMIDFVTAQPTRLDLIDAFYEITQEMDHVKGHQNVR